MMCTATLCPPFSATAPPRARRLVRVCAYCGAVACAVRPNGTPAAWVPAGRPAAAELRAAYGVRGGLRASHGVCPACFAAQVAG